MWVGSSSEFGPNASQVISVAVEKALCELYDVPMAGAGFSRIPQSESYHRKISDGMQTISFVTALESSTSAKCISVALQIDIDLPEIGQAIEPLLKSHFVETAHERSTEAALVFHFASDEYRWLVYGLEELNQLVRETVVDIVTTVLLPLLDRMNSVTKFAEMSAGDIQLIFRRGRAEWLYLAIAKLLRDDPEGALAVLEEAARRPPNLVNYVPLLNGVRQILSAKGLSNDFAILETLNRSTETAAHNWKEAVASLLANPNMKVACPGCKSGLLSIEYFDMLTELDIRVQCDTCGSESWAVPTSNEEDKPST